MTTCLIAAAEQHSENPLAEALLASNVPAEIEGRLGLFVAQDTLRLEGAEVPTVVCAASIGRMEQLIGDSECTAAAIAVPLRLGCRAGLLLVHPGHRHSGQLVAAELQQGGCP